MNTWSLSLMSSSSRFNGRNFVSSSGLDVQQPDGIDAVWLVKAVEGNEDAGLFFFGQLVGEVPEECRISAGKER